MPKINVEIGFKEVDNLVRQLEELADKSEEMCKRAIYEGGDVVGDEMKRLIKGIPTVEDFKQGSSERQIVGGTKDQIDGLIESMGLAPIQYYGHGLNTKIGFDGYNDVKTKKYPNGQPNMMIARSINAGTSFRRAYPFVERCGRNAKLPAEAAMAASLQGAIDSIVNN